MSTMKPVVFAIGLLVVCGAIIAFGFRVGQGTPIAKPPVVSELQWGVSAVSADRTITWDKDYNYLTFSENWPLENQICVPEGCLSIGDIRKQLSGAVR